MSEVESGGVWSQRGKLDHVAKRSSKMITGFCNSEFIGDLAKCVFSAVLGQESWSVSHGWGAQSGNWTLRFLGMTSEFVISALICGCHAGGMGSD